MQTPLHLICRIVGLAWASVLFVGLAPTAPAADLIPRADEAALTHFREQIVPLLESRCLRCHEGATPDGELSLVTRDGLTQGGTSGPAIVLGQPDDSLILDAISGEEPEMPKEGPPLTDAEVAAIRQWIAAGAPWPAGIELTDNRPHDLNWWSLQPLVRPPVPALNDAWIRTPIDAFILEKLQACGLAPSPEADRRTLLRRLYFDLTGLPPTPEETQAFLADESPDAYEALVDRLLASPRYGERWGRHWLDVAHYGDTHGYDKDKVRPNAWPYRDYVIRSFNDDKPYRRFLEEQIAGDVLFPDSPDGVIATGFLVAGPFDFVGQIEVADGTLAKAITRNLDRDDMVTTVVNTFNSMTAQCARCHNHKFDPISQEDYYSLQAVFAGVDRAERPYGAGDPAELPRTFAAASDFAPHGAFTPTKGVARPIRLLKRGNEATPGGEVDPGTCGYLPALGSRFELDATAGEGARRAALAKWLSHRGNPLTWRSIVNRVWQYHFGRGIVDTPNDFGRMGSLPTHPELLDWLAVEFRDGPQSLKTLHRLICTSAVYRQASAGNPAFESIDGANQFLWRMNRRKLEAEAVRDAALAVAGQLDLTAGGPGFRAFEFRDDESPHYDYEQCDPADPQSHRRSVYRQIVRSVPDPFMTTLDCADSSAAVAKRNETLTPLQALAMLNNRFMVSMAEQFAKRIEPLGADDAHRLAAAWQFAFARPPTLEELAPLVAYAGKHGLANACRVIFNMNEFVFID
jgi:mono/diheme cytochrome c family protein